MRVSDDDRMRELDVPDDGWIRIPHADNEYGLLTMDDKWLHVSIDGTVISVDVLRYDGETVGYVELDKPEVRKLRDFLSYQLGETSNATQG